MVEAKSIVVYYDDFKTWISPSESDSKYYFFSIPGVLTGDDGQISKDGDLLSIDVSKFTKTLPTALDHVKNLFYCKNPISPCKEGSETVFETVLSVQQTNLSNIPESIRRKSDNYLTGISNINADPRPATSGLALLDVESFITYDFLLTNENIFAFYERLPFGRPELGGTLGKYASFTHMIPVGKRNPDDFVKLAIAYNYKHNTVRWLINDVEVYSITRIGYPLNRKYRNFQFDIPGEQPAPGSLIRSESINFGLGCFSLMDFYNTDNPGAVPNVALVDLSLGGIIPSANPIITKIDGKCCSAHYMSSYPIDDYNGTNWGQGVKMQVKYITVYIKPEESREWIKNPVVLESTQELNSINGVNAIEDLVYGNLYIPCNINNICVKQGCTYLLETKNDLFKHYNSHVLEKLGKK